MKKTQTSKARFVQYLAGLAMATAPSVPANAGTPPATSDTTKIAFADNLMVKMAVAAPSAINTGGGGGYRQTFGDVYEQVTFTEIQPHLEGAGGMLPSQAFKFITGA